MEEKALNKAGVSFVKWSEIVLVWMKSFVPCFCRFNFSSQGNAGSIFSSNHLAAHSFLEPKNNW